MSSTQPSVTPDRIMQLTWGYAPPLILEAAIRHRVFDVLDNGPKTVEEVEDATGACARGLTALMNALVGLNLLTKDVQGHYTLTPESAAFLVSTKPGFQGGMILHCSQHLIPKWLRLDEIVATGKPVEPVNQQRLGGDFFSKFVADILPRSYGSAQTLAAALDLNGAGKPVSVLDLAAGSGVWGIALAQKSPYVHVTAVDWPEVIAITRKTVASFGLMKRFRFIPGDLLAADFGANHAVATLGHILHSEGEERSRTLLQRAFDALAPGGTIAVAEILVNDERTEPLGSLLFAVNMLVNTDNGDTYSFREISSWLREAGFVNARTLDAPGPSPLILATKP
ncbi:MAG: methyltransferase [Terriglobia bacterium]|jgi:predicted O-methyltransferase YrrM